MSDRVAYVHAVPELQGCYHQMETRHLTITASCSDQKCQCCVVMCRGCYWFCATDQDLLEKVLKDYEEA